MVYGMDYYSIKTSGLKPSIENIIEKGGNSTLDYLLNMDELVWLCGDFASGHISFSQAYNLSMSSRLICD